MSTRISEHLVKTGLLTEEQLKRTLAAQKTSGISLSEQLAEFGYLAEVDFKQIVAEQYGLTVIDLNNYNFNQALAQILPYNLATKHSLVPLVQKDKNLTLAMSDPSNLLALNDVKFITGCDLQVVVASDREIKQGLELLYQAVSGYAKAIDPKSAEKVEVIEIGPNSELGQFEGDTGEAPVEKLVNAILADAIKKSASDIHIEPYEKEFRVRFRIDGVLYEIMRPPLKLRNALASRIKIMADLDIAERRLPQDGRIKIKIGGNREMDFRINILPTVYGEKVVMRLLDKTNTQYDLLKLGFDARQQQLVREAISKPHGMFLVTGPTGSGKTTTLYSVLAELNKVTTNISTAEDPVEYNMGGINQAQINDDIGFNFAAALRSFLRQDPDVIMLGEIRDYETAEIAIKASLTGHLVLSSLHTNDAPSSVNRLLNMGVEPFLVASSVNLIVAQRLARRICSHCSQEIELNPELLVNIGVPAAEARHSKVRQGKGCNACAGTGYKGRIALYEVMPITEELREFMLNGASAIELKREAIRLGMVTLRSSGIKQMQAGVTSIEEVLRVTAAD